MTAQVRQWLYRIGALASALVPILVGFHLLTETQGNQWLGLVAALSGVLGVAGSGTAAVVLGKQRKDGTLDTAAPADAAINAIQQTVQNVTTANTELDRVKQAASDALGTAAVVLGPLAQQAINSVLPRA